LVIPNPLVEGYVKQALAAGLGIAANVETHFLRGFLREVAAASAPGVRIVDRDLLEGELLALFHDQGWLAGPELGPLRDYLSGGAAPVEAEGLDRKRVQLAAELATLFDEYTFSRPEMLAAWRSGALDPLADEGLQRWQRALWLALLGPRGALSAKEIVTLPDFFARTPADALRPPPAVHLFGISYVARLYGAIFDTLGRATDLFVYALGPDRSSAAGGADPAGSDGAPLAAWGRPGRDNVHLLVRLAGAVDARFVDPASGARPTHLAALQQAVLDGKPLGARARADDDSLTVVPAPDPRRELETIAAEIWARLRADATLTLADFAVIVPQASAPLYLPLAEAVFEEASRLPHTVVDLARPAERRITDVIGLLLELPLGGLARPDLLGVVMHPTVARRFPEVDPEDWLALCEGLEIVRGADRADQAQSYLARDRTSWEQGLRRLALGAFLSGPGGGDTRPFDLDGEAVLPFDVPVALEPAARALGIVARQLLAFARAARGGPAPFAVHAALLRQTIAETIVVEPGDEEAVLGDALAAIERVAALVPPELPVSFRVAADLVKARLAETPRRHRSPEGVTVASFVPMRALPFRHIFVAGLDEGVFPAPEGVRALDLRAGARHPGDVTPREQDQHLTLETVLAARDRLTLSYVARDPVTGEARPPSAVVSALCEAFEADSAARTWPFAEGSPSATVRPAPPLARHEDPAACAVIPSAARERRAAALGASLRRAGGGRRLPPLGELRAAMPADVWQTVAAELDWAAPPVAATGARARRGLTLFDLRRFLECPLQASARVLLPLTGDDDAQAEAEAALREHEPLDEERLRTVPFLREIAVELLAGPEEAGDAELAAAYDRAAEIKRLEGALPDGLFGRALRERHLALLRCWRAGVWEKVGRLPVPPEPLWLGGAPEHRADVALVPPITLAISAGGDGGATVALGGRTELCARGSDDSRLVLKLLSSVYKDYPERDLLEPFFTHLALAALGDGRPTRALVIRPGEDGTPKYDERTFGPVDAETARAYLGALAGELLREVHPYFLPCEAVFTWKRRADKGEPIGVREAVLLLRDDNWTRFVSDRGPIPDPREYPVPAENEALEIVERRFHPYLTAIAVEPRPKGKKR
jgi:exodeoxyribonuclease V gamma subunit